MIHVGALQHIGTHLRKRPADFEDRLAVRFGWRSDLLNPE